MSVCRAWRLYAGVKEAKKMLITMKLLHSAKLEAIIPMQSIVRMYIAKLLAHMHRMGGLVAWFAREVKSRGLVGKALTNFRIRKRAEMRRQNGATKIQTMIRGVLGRKIFRKAYKQLMRYKAVREKNKNLRAIVKLQCMVRRVLAKATVNARRLVVMQQEQHELELEEIESKLDSRHTDWMQHHMAIRAQTSVRGMLATK